MSVFCPLQSAARKHACFVTVSGLWPHGLFIVFLAVCLHVAALDTMAAAKRGFATATRQIEHFAPMASSHRSRMGGRSQTTRLTRHVHYECCAVLPKMPFEACQTRGKWKGGRALTRGPIIPLLKRQHLRADKSCKGWNGSIVLWGNTQSWALFN